MKMSANRENRANLTNLAKNLESEKNLSDKIVELRQKVHDNWEDFVRHDDETEFEYLELMQMNKRRIHRLNEERNAIMRQREEYVRKFINKEEICVSNAAHIEAIIFLKREGWTGRALVRRNELAIELSKNNIPFNLHQNCC